MNKSQRIEMETRIVVHMHAISDANEDERINPVKHAKHVYGRVGGSVHELWEEGREKKKRLNGREHYY